MNYFILFFKVDSYQQIFIIYLNIIYQLSYINYFYTLSIFTRSNNTNLSKLFQLFFRRPNLPHNYYSVFEDRLSPLKLPYPIQIVCKFGDIRSRGLLCALPN